MNWQEVCGHPNLQNLPFKLELNEYGQIVMSPAQVHHSILQGEIAALLKSLRQARSLKRILNHKLPNLSLVFLAHLYRRHAPTHSYRKMP
ncbi:hypothetical protein VSS37_13085 [Candidatus Thiothrix sp. Deng01]|uniref:Restriction endonuclease domain-containing protein n=1 Tax=Candidatus Thiothrix phosphatis TaxID=3112415 RepID=A0ABU6CYR6_9GAMM|nr:hypothetical protein [Candidatus Thiothrix sp. Deng01]MEB4591920.1 hypothetical protein [Candidatus Thiothrix sp. Deng01]